MVLIWHSTRPWDATKVMLLFELWSCWMKAAEKMRNKIDLQWTKRNTWIYNLSSGPHITSFLAVAAKKRINFE